MTLQHPVRPLWRADRRRCGGRSYGRWIPVALAGGAMLTVGLAVARRARRSLARVLHATEQAARQRAGGDRRGRAPIFGLPETRAVTHATDGNADAGDSSCPQQPAPEAGDLDRAHRDLMATVSHELRTPLTSIVGYLEMLEGDAADLTAHQRRAVAAMSRNTTRLRVLIEDFLTVSAVECGAFSSRRAPVDLGKLIAEAVADMQAIADEAGVALTASLPAQPLTVVGDHTQLRRVLTDLLSNAIKFTPVGGHATVQAAEKPHGAALIVSDNGIGVPATDQKQLFTRFFRASNATENAAQGAGLGLAIVKAIITHHNGELKLASTEGRGTTVTIHLPRPEPGS